MAVRWLRMRVVVRVTCSGLGVHGVTSHARRTCVVFRQKKKCYTGLAPRPTRPTRPARAGRPGGGGFHVLQFLLQNCKFKRQTDGQATTRQIFWIIRVE